MSIEVRPVVASDRDAWARLFVAYGVFYETTFSDEIVGAVWEWLLDADHEVSALVAVRDDEVIGFANYRRLFDTFTAASAWNLDDLYVTPEARGAGAASALINGVAEVATANGGGTLRWITAENNTTAQRVYDTLATRATWVTYERQT